ncbi:hypothetical protein MRX96_026887 [Rhipicephalus microplus]
MKVRESQQENNKTLSEKSTSRGKCARIIATSCVKTPGRQEVGRHCGVSAALMNAASLGRLSEKTETTLSERQERLRAKDGGWNPISNRSRPFFLLNSRLQRAPRIPEGFVWAFVATIARWW